MECCSPDQPCPKHKQALANFCAEVQRIMGARQVGCEVEPGKVTVQFEREPKQ